MVLQVLGHFIETNFVIAIYLGQLPVGDEELPVFRILKLVHFQVTIKFYDAFCTAYIYSLADNGSQCRRECHWIIEG